MNETSCKYGDQICPCQDGDPCHYEPHGDTPAMNVPPECVLRALGAEREACALQVRHDCSACNGSGHLGEDECEYCGRPMAAIRARAKSAKAT